tara:strand:+ start:115 stop:495 length:381 start_codon:yes stop_codon:yes gene_type:complete
MTGTPVLWDDAHQAGVLAATRTCPQQVAAIEAGCAVYIQSRQGAGAAAHRRPAQQAGIELSARVAAREAMRRHVVSTWPSRQPGYTRPNEEHEPPPVEPEELADIEIERNKNVAHNQEILRQLGLA